MRTLKALVLSGLLLIGSTTATFAAETSTVTQSTVPSTERFNDDGGGMANPTTPSNDSDYERWV